MTIHYITIQYISTIKSDLEKWTLIPFARLASRVEVVKTNILPRLLYVFQTLPVEVTGTDFIEWEKLISRYIWQGSRPLSDNSSIAS